MSENGTLRRGRPGYDQQGILDVAVAAFNQYGYDATSMGVLADRLGLSKSAIYHHFASKDEILDRALDTALAALEGVLEETDAARGRAADRLDHVLRGAVHVLVEKLPYVTLLLRVRGNTEVERRALARRRAFDKRVTALVSEAQAEGSLRSDIDVRIVERLLFGMINSIVEWYRPGGHEDADTARRRRHRRRARRAAHADVEPRRGAARLTPDAAEVRAAAPKRTTKGEPHDRAARGPARRSASASARSARSRHPTTARCSTPAIDAALAEHDKINLVFVLGGDFDHYSLGAMLEDAKLITHAARGVGPRGVRHERRRARGHRDRVRRARAGRVPGVPARHSRTRPSRGWRRPCRTRPRPDVGAPA